MGKGRRALLCLEMRTKNVQNTTAPMTGFSHIWLMPCPCANNGENETCSNIDPKVRRFREDGVRGGGFYSICLLILCFFILLYRVLRGI
jgi:hypothetical protein